MSFLRNLATDLVEKRLWPIAAALVAALVAVPLALGGGGKAVAPAAPAAPAAGGSAEGVARTLKVSGSVPAERSRPGRARNPFEVLRGGEETAAPSGGGTTAVVAAPVTSTVGPAGALGNAGATGVPSAPGSAPAGSGGTQGDGSPGGGSPGGGDGELDVYRVSLRFGRPGAMRTIRDIARLTPLPSADNPFFVFLGVLKDRKTLVFMLSSDTQATGDGKCRPSARDCQTIELQAGDTEFFDLVTEAGTAVQYQMDVKGLDRVEARTAARAAAARARGSRAGQRVLRAAAARTSTTRYAGYRYRPDLGLLVRAARKRGARDAAGASVAGRARPRTVTRPGEVPVWRTRPRAATG
jgi:hypothetical protein